MLHARDTTLFARHNLTSSPRSSKTFLWPLRRSVRYRFHRDPASSSASSATRSWIRSSSGTNEKFSNLAEFPSPLVPYDFIPPLLPSASPRGAFRCDTVTLSRTPRTGEETKDRATEYARARETESLSISLSGSLLRNGQISRHP
jgi:hypothetical protein